MMKYHRDQIVGRWIRRDHLLIENEKKLSETGHRKMKQYT